MTSQTLSSFLIALFSTTAVGGDFSSPRLDAITSWIGNTYGGAQKWVQQDIHAMAVTPDGTVFTNVPWDEGGGNAGEYRNGELIRYAMHTHGWGNMGGEAVAANSRYLFIGMAVANEGGHLVDAQTWPPKGSQWLGVSRRTRTDIGQGAPFEGGKGGKGGTIKDSFLVVTEIPDNAKDSLPGMCADETHLYVTDPASSQIKVYNAETMLPIASWKIDLAGPLALDRNGTVWMLRPWAKDKPATFVRFNAKGEEQSPALTLPPDLVPKAFCFANDGRVLVADEGPTQQVRIFSIKDSALVETGTFGERGGMASGTPGAFADRKLNHVSAIGCDAKDNLYLAHDAQSGGGGTVLESYALASGKLNWRLQGLTFVDMADVDDEDDAEVFTKEEHFHLDYSKPPGSEARYAGYTVGYGRYPQDPRMHLWSGGAWVRHIGGRRILFVNDMNAGLLQSYRFEPETDGEIAIPSGFFASRHLKDTADWPPYQPEKGEWIWRDTNGNGAFDADEYQTNDGADSPAAQGWWVDRAGNIWRATETRGLRFFPFLGLDAHGNPQWDFKTMRTFPHPAGFKEVKRLRYDAKTDTLYLGGTTTAAANQHWKPMGPVIACYDGWLHGAQKQRWQVTLPYGQGTSGHESCEPMGFDISGDFIFVPYTGASKAEGVKTGRVEIFRTRDGSAAGHVEPGPEVGEIGLQDLRETLTAHRRANGEYIVLLEDDYKSKVVMYRFKELK